MVVDIHVGIHAHMNSDLKTLTKESSDNLRSISLSKRNSSCIAGALLLVSSKDCHWDWPRPLKPVNIFTHNSSLRHFISCLKRLMESGHYIRHPCLIDRNTTWAISTELWQKKIRFCLKSDKYSRTSHEDVRILNTRNWPLLLFVTEKEWNLWSENWSDETLQHRVSNVIVNVSRTSTFKIYQS